jgi:hypothetical protein
MGAWLLGLPVFAMSAVILVGIYLFTAAVYVLVTSLAVGDRGRAFKAVSPGMLPPLAIIFALLMRPFTGEISVRPTVLLQVMPEAGH